MDVLLAGNEPSLWKGRLPALNVQRHYLWKSFRAKSNTIPGSTEKCSAWARNPVRLQPGIAFGINPERCSASPRKPVRLDPESPSWTPNGPRRRVGPRPDPDSLVGIPRAFSRAHAIAGPFSVSFVEERQEDDNSVAICLTRLTRYRQCETRVSLCQKGAGQA